MVEIPEVAKDSDKFPKFVISIRLDNMPDAIDFSKDLRVKSRLTQLDPLFESPLQISKICGTNETPMSSSNDEDLTYVLLHPNGKTIQDIIKEKMLEKDGEISKGDVQGGTIEGMYDYNKCHFAEIKFDPNIKGFEILEQDVVILNAESPTQIFVCPSNQIGLAEHLQDQIRSYVAAVGDNFMGAAPIPNHLCIAKSMDDEQWYRAVCCKELGEDMYELMFVDFGNVENIERKNIMHMAEEIMKTPLLANHCVLEGFEDAKKSDIYQKVFGDQMQQLLPAFEETKITVIKKLPNTATYIVRISKIASIISPDLMPKDNGDTKQNITIKESEEPKNEAIKNISKDADKVVEYKIMRNSLKNLDVSLGDEVVGCAFGKSFNIVTVQRIIDAEKLEELGNLLKDKCKKPMPFTPIVGQLVACKWSEDGEFYRAEIVSVRKADSKAIVFFVDYGNDADESFENFMDLPIEATRVPIFSSAITLDGVSPSTLTKEYGDLKHVELEKLLESELKVISKNNGTYTLKLSDGKILSEMINKILNDISETGSTTECDKEVDKIISSATNSNTTKEKTSESITAKKESLGTTVPTIKSMLKTTLESGDSVLGLGFAQFSNTIYVQRLDDAEKLEKLGNILNECVGKPLVHMPEIGQIVSCRWSEDQELYRAEILEKLDGNKVKVYFIDFGNTETEAVGNVMNLPFEASKIPVLASLVAMDGVVSLPKLGNEHLSNILKNVEAELLDDVLEVVSSKDIMYVLKQSDGKLFNETLQEKLHAINQSKETISTEVICQTNNVKNEAAKSTTPCLIKNMTRVSVNKGDALLGLAFGDMSDEIYVQRLQDAETIENLGTILKSKCQNEALTYLPKIGQVVACKWSEDDELYRAEVIGVQPGNKVLVHFIDFGNRELEALSNVMKLPQEVISIPVLATMINLDGVKSLAKSGNQNVFETLQNYESKLLEDICDVVSVANKKYVLKQSDGNLVNDILQAQIDEAIKCKETLSKEVTSEENLKELHEKLEKEANKRKADDAKRKADDAKRKEMEDQIKKMQEMLANMPI